jgi:hypothetical protein
MVSNKDEDKYTKFMKINLMTTGGSNLERR